MTDLQDELNKKAMLSKDQMDIDAAVKNSIEHAESIIGSCENDIYNHVSMTLEIIGVSNSESEVLRYIKKCQ